MANSKRKCKLCKEYTTDFIKTNVGVFCCFDHAIEWGKQKADRDRIKAAERARREKEKTIKEKDKAFKLSDTRYQHTLTQPVFNRMRVLEEKLWFMRRGIEPFCISCGKTNMDWCCGHFKTVGSSGALRYDVRNTFLQCNRYCNKGKSGNIEGCKNTHGYKKGLLLRFGDDLGQEILDYCESHQADIKKWTGEELSELRKDLNWRVRKLKSKL